MADQAPAVPAGTGRSGPLGAAQGEHYQDAGALALREPESEGSDSEDSDSEDSDSEGSDRDSEPDMDAEWVRRHLLVQHSSNWWTDPPGELARHFQPLLSVTGDAEEVWSECVGAVWRGFSMVSCVNPSSEVLAVVGDALLALPPGEEQGPFPLSEEAARRLSLAVSRSKSLSFLLVRGYALPGAVSWSLCRAWGRCAALSHLRLDQCVLGPAWAEALASLLRRGGGALRVLELSRNGLGDAACAAVLRELPHTRLCSLRLRHEELGAASAGALAQVLRDNSAPRLRELWLTACRLHTKELETLGAALESNRTLTELSLLGCDEVSTESCRALARALRRNTTLRTLDLALCDVVCSGAEALTQAMELNTTLTSLRLEGNELCPFCGELLAIKDAVQRNIALRDLVPTAVPGIVASLRGLLAKAPLPDFVADAAAHFAAADLIADLPFLTAAGQLCASRHVYAALHSRILAALCDKLNEVKPTMVGRALGIAVLPAMQGRGLGLLHSHFP
jgi:hypothetical protein